MIALSLEAGPMVGQLLEALKEEQAAGEISGREQALKWLRNKYKQIETN